MTTSLEIARLALDRIHDAMRSGGPWGDEALQIIIEAVDAGRREGEIDGEQDGIATGEHHSSDAVATVLNGWFYAPLTRQEDAP
jgi:hypothetical protein